MPNTIVNSKALTGLDATSLIVQPVTTQSVAMQVCTVFISSETSTRLPVVTADPSAGWFAELAEITQTDQAVSELTVTPAKVAGLTLISNELADDSSPDAKQVVGDGLVRSIVQTVDRAFFGAALPAPAPGGLASVTGFSNVAQAATWTTFDTFQEAIAAAEAKGATINAWVAHPSEVLALAQVKGGTGSAVPLLGSDPTKPTQRVIAGIPLYSSPHVPLRTVWGIPKAHTFAIVRKDAKVEQSAESAFTRDALHVRAIMRVGFGFPHPGALVKISRAV